jgi:guanylate kinase
VSEIKPLKQNVLVIVGPSGVGKSFLTKRLIENYPFKLVLSTTTRSIRPGEVQNVDMNFVSEEEYDELENDGDMFMSNSFLNARYGYRRSFIEGIKNEGKIPVAIVYSTVVDQFYREFPESFGIFLYPSNPDLLKYRMKNRGDTDETIERRMLAMQQEVDAYEGIAYRFLQKKIDISNDSDALVAIDVINDYYFGD